MLVVATLWWIVFFAAVGLTFGSYLNVVIYRTPRGLSTSAPLWSFCPICGARIHWYDNLPVLSYIRLGGRCRACGVPISPRYPAIELLMATLTLVLFDAFCVAGLRGGHRELGLTSQLAYDWPILLAHLILFGCLLAMSAIDLEHYFIDIRFTSFAVLAGFVLHLIWTPAVSGWATTVGTGWYRPGPTTGAMSLVVALVVWLTSWALRRFAAPLDQAHAEGLAQDSAPVAVTPARSGLAPVAAWLVALVFLLLAGFTTGDALSTEPRLFPAWRLWVPMALCFVLTVGAGVPPRRADTEIIEAIEAERHGARTVVLQELLMLLPAVVSGVVVVWICLKNDAFRRVCGGVLSWGPRGSWHPLLGLVTAASGYVIGGALGWAVRIVFTLILGREAFGTGDIHLMAAAGCVAGWPVVVMGFVLTSFLALAGWVALLPFKRTRAIPLVPWLSLAFLVVVVFYNRLLELGPVQNTVLVFKAVLSGKLTGLSN
ncbi:MAG: A24 family peptidase [Planctomycetota bacterium]